MASKQTAVLQAVEVNGNTYEVPVTMEGLVEAINEQAKLIAAAEGSAFEHSAIEGNFLVEARRRVKAEKKKGEKGWMKWLEDNYQYKRESAYRSISIAENFDLVRDADSRMEALRIIEAHKKAAIEAGTVAPHGNRRRIAAPTTEVVPPTVVSTNGNGDGREEHRAAQSELVNAINEASTATFETLTITPTHTVLVSPAPVDEEDEGPSDSDLDDPENLDIVREFEESAPEAAAPLIVDIVRPEVMPEGAATMRFQFTGSPQQVELQSFQATLDRFEVELGPVTLNRAFDVDLKSLTHTITDIQCKLSDLMERIIKVSEDRKIRTDLKAARQEGLV